MISLTKKQIIILSILGVLLLGGLGIYFYFKTSSSQSDSIDLTGNILENTVSSTENSTEESTKEMTEEEKTDFIFIHITGCIASPGLISLPEGSRVADAIAKAGGITENADLSQINLAYILEDGLKLYIPSYADKAKKEASDILSNEVGDNILIEDAQSTSSTQKGQKVNINTASQTELETVPGIGPSTALKIIAYRKEHGAFSKIEDIQNIKGIGEAKYAEMKNSICVK